ncbi:uncharacterized protein MELLADRAFT_94918 [Melampsora larici-populina 98AG31]|uniref:Uncharacterized protein n=1 Tax=Melampsora larici-populina (strain 98AG31 / pathotype 3-4-7) TaxID=747676 RepID=F4S8F0_MELLP|nr:uncharacterized protein MELLADRAFT_94918 [Melampsora larici-populina 98AG31]EGF99102.1 hypothetical protein MELLADRAFT_94918 [Melampsora larici-populina 98AG31]
MLKSEKGLVLPCSLFFVQSVVPLLHGYERIEKVKPGDSDTFLLTDASTGLQAGTEKSNRGIFKSIFQAGKGGLKPFFVTQPRTPDGEFLISWEVCYEISHKAFASSPPSRTQEMAEAVLKFGPQFDRHQDDPEVEMEHIMSTIDLFSRSLEEDKLSAAERIWAVGVLSYLRSRISEENKTVIPSLWTADDLRRPRAGRVAIVSPARSNLQNLDIKTKHGIRGPADVEIIQRESVVHLISNLGDLGHDDPSIHFQKVYLAFINLKTPINRKTASSLMGLMRLIGEQLKSSKTPTKKESNTIRMLLHLVEYHYESSSEFTKLTRIPDIRGRILENAIRFQLEDKQLDPFVRDLLLDFQNKKFVDSDRTSEILHLIKEDRISIPQLGRLWRVITLVHRSDREMYPDHAIFFSQHSEMIPKLHEMVWKFRYGRMNPEKFWDYEIEPFVFGKWDKRAAQKYRTRLAKRLISKGLLTGRETIRDTECLTEGIKKRVLTTTLYGIVKKVSDDKAVTRTKNKYTDYLIAEYILHLISFKNDDKILYNHLFFDQHVLGKTSKDYTPFFKKLSQKVFEFIDSPVWHDDGQPETFAKALKQLETSIPSVTFAAERGKYQDASLPI